MDVWTDLYVHHRLVRRLQWGFSYNDTTLFTKNEQFTRPTMLYLILDPLWIKKV